MDAKKTNDIKRAINTKKTKKRKRATENKKTICFKRATLLEKTRILKRANGAKKTKKDKRAIRMKKTIEPDTTHSEKPEEFRKLIDKLYPEGKRIELFARNGIKRIRKEVKCV